MIKLINIFNFPIFHFFVCESTCVYRIWEFSCVGRFAVKFDVSSLCLVQNKKIKIRILVRGYVREGVARRGVGCVGRGQVESYRGSQKS